MYVNKIVIEMKGGGKKRKKRDTRRKRKKGRTLSL
jgi:hypothetical protein